MSVGFDGQTRIVQIHLDFTILFVSNRWIHLEWIQRLKKKLKMQVANGDWR